MHAFFADSSAVERAVIIAAAASAALLAGAHAFEHVGGLAPCELCLDQREAHWTALAFSLIGALFAFVIRSRRAAAAAAACAALVYLASSGLALYHVGVEYKYWSGPATCSGGGPVAIEGSLLDALNEKPARPACSDVAWRLFGVSMAGYNLLVSAGLFALCLHAAAVSFREQRSAARPKPGLSA